MAFYFAEAYGTFQVSPWGIEGPGKFQSIAIMWRIASDDNGIKLKINNKKNIWTFSHIASKQIILNNLVKENYKNIAHGVIMKTSVSNPCKLLLLFAFSKTEQLNIKTTVCFNQG